MHSYLPSSDENGVTSRVPHPAQLPAQPESRLKASAPEASLVSLPLCRPLGRVREHDDPKMGQESNEQTHLGTLGTELQKGQSKGDGTVRESLCGAGAEGAAGGVYRERTGGLAGGLDHIHGKKCCDSVRNSGCVNNRNLEIRDIKK